MRLVVDREIRGAESVFSAFGDVTLGTGRTLSRADLNNAEVLFVRSVTRVDASLLAGSPVKIVGTATAGTDHIDVDYLSERGIVMFDAAGCNARAVAEYVLACSLLGGALDDYPARPARIGIVGYGHVGKQVADVFGALGIECVINDPPLAAAGAGGQFSGLADALRCDIVTLHVPLTDDGDFPTRNMLRAAELAQIRDGALLINAARGGVIDESALSDWGRERGSGIAIDCWEREPHISPRLLGLVTLGTPHIAGHTIEARMRAASLLSHQLAEYCALAVGADEPATHTELIDIGTGHENFVAAIRAAVLRCCDPAAVTGRLRDTVRLDDSGRGAAFDELRRNSAGRREFGHYRIASNGLQPDTVNRLRGLGFHINANGNQ